MAARMRAAAAVFCAALGCLAAHAAAHAADPFAGTWEARVATPKNPYTMRLRCASAQECETQVVTGAPKDAQDPATAFKNPVARPNAGPMREALAYALAHRKESAANPEFAAIHKLLAASVNEKTQLDSCVSLDASAPDFFVLCSVDRAASMRPVLLFFGSLQGLCGQGFCKYVVYPMVRVR